MRTSNFEFRYSPYIWTQVFRGLKNLPDEIKTNVFHHFRFCENGSCKYLTSLIMDMLHFICFYTIFTYYLFLISDFRRDLNIEYVLLGISPDSNCSRPTFKNPVSVPSSKAGGRLIYVFYKSKIFILYYLLICCYWL